MALLVLFSAHKVRRVPNETSESIGLLVLAIIYVSATERRTRLTSACCGIHDAHRDVKACCFSLLPYRKRDLHDSRSVMVLPGLHGSGLDA